VTKASRLTLRSAGVIGLVILGILLSSSDFCSSGIEIFISYRRDGDEDRRGERGPVTTEKTLRDVVEKAEQRRGILKIGKNKAAIISSFGAALQRALDKLWSIKDYIILSKM
jgi:hypothetical protein